MLAEAERIDPQAREMFDLRETGLIRKGEEALVKGDLEAAEEAFEQALVKGGAGTLDACCGLAQVHLDRGEPDSAERALKEAEKIDPASPDTSRRATSSSRKANLRKREIHTPAPWR